jgi:hypothetical protein
VNRCPRWQGGSVRKPKSLMMRVLCGTSLLGSLQACGGGTTVDPDRTPPTVTILSPAEGDTVGRSTVYVVRVTGIENDRGLFCPSIVARISGDDFSGVFQSSCSVGEEEIRVPSGRVLLPGPLPYTLTFNIDDAAGNTGSATRRFFVEDLPPAQPEPPPPI